MTSSARISAYEPQAAARGAADGPRAGPGCGDVRVELSGGRSVVRRAFATSPLRLLTPRNHGPAAWIYTSSYGGGLVGGDDVRLRVAVGAGASAFLSTQASTKVYRSARGSDVTLEASVDPAGLLVSAPDPVVCFARSRYRQRQHVRLAADAGAVLVDWLCSGRRAAGERWAFDEYTSRTIVQVDGRLVVHDALALRASDGDLAARFGRFDVLALVVIAGAALRDEAAAVVAAVAVRPLVRRADELVAAAALDAGGCVVRVAGRSAEQVGRTIRGLLGFLPSRLHDDPWERKW